MKKRRGFSLLELLIVMAIITIVLSIMVPALYQLIKFVRHLGQ